MRYLAIGDIHGCFRALSTLVEFVDPKDDDVLITLGDYVDRGTDSRAVLDWLIATSQTRKLIPLLGNHEWMMLQARSMDRHLQYWLDCGGDATLKSYSPFEGDMGKMVDVPDEHWDFLENTCHRIYETEDFIFVHANLSPDLPVDEQPDFMTLWQPLVTDPTPHESGKLMICGHTSQRSGVPRFVRRAVCIDTWAYGKGWLTCLDPDSQRYWQANERGETRTGVLEEIDPALEDRD